MPYSNYAVNKIIDHVDGRTSYTMPACYLGLFTTLPTGPSNAGTEASGGSYARTAIGTGGASLYGAAASGTATNASQVNITAPAGTIVGAGMWDNSSGGNLLAYWNLQQSATAEVVTLSSGHGILAHSPAENLTVKNNTDATTYVEGTDYYVNYDAGTLERIATGSITSSQVLHITYNYPTTKVTTDGDTIIGSVGNYGFALKGFQA